MAQQNYTWEVWEENCRTGKRLTKSVFFTNGDEAERYQNNLRPKYSTKDRQLTTICCTCHWPKQ